MRWITPDDLSRPGDLPFVVLAQMIGDRILQSDSAFASSHRIVSNTAVLSTSRPSPTDSDHQDGADFFSPMEHFIHGSC
jgi:hypothetical protein